MLVHELTNTPALSVASRQSPASEGHPTAADDEQHTLSGLAVLVVDDDEDVRELVSEALADLGATVTAVQHGQQAIDTMSAGLVPDVVILDLMMPVVTGWGVWDWLQATASHRGVPVVVLTASGLSQGAVGRARVLKKGAGIDVLAGAILETIKSWR